MSAINVNSVSLDAFRSRGIEGVVDGAPIGAGGASGLTDGGISFESLLGNMVEQSSALDHTAGLKAEALASGASDDLHGTMISAKEAEISLKLVGSVRNKLIDAFHELWRTSV